MTDKLRTYSAPRDLMERAMNSTNGIRVWFGTRAEAQSMKNRMATVKTEDRKQSCKVHPFGHALYNTSSYDGISSHIQPVEVFQGERPDGYPAEGFWLYVCPEDSATTGMFIEEL